jgi:histidinol dehydrogenase
LLTKQTALNEKDKKVQEKLMKIKKLKMENRQNLLQRPITDEKADEAAVSNILQEIKKRGDAALLEYTARFDKVKLEAVAVSSQEITEADRQVSEQLKKAIQRAAANIKDFHQAQFPHNIVLETEPGVVCRQEWRPIEKVGLYIPGGSAPLFSSVLMLAIPAKIAACREIILCTPPKRDGKIHPAILYAADLCGVSQIFKVGGAQAIAAMAYGTKSIPKMDKIFGPGNRFVTIAKQLVSRRDVAIDMPAGPSELLIIADESANADFLAADLLSQSEHGTDSQTILVSPDEKLLKQIPAAIEKQLLQRSRRAILTESLKHTRLILTDSLAEAIDFSNEYAPEHLILAVKDPERYSPQILNAGSVFLGNFTPESAGDYASGTNHTLPTGAFARSYSGLNTLSFMKAITFQNISANGLRSLGPVIETMAEAEELDAHQFAVTIRLKALSEAK